jgi:hypothetical protein
MAPPVSPLFTRKMQEPPERRDRRVVVGILVVVLPLELSKNLWMVYVNNKLV